MIISGNRILKEVTGLSKEKKQMVKDFLQGAVYCWCKNKKDEWFALKDLVGGENYNWSGIPLFDLWNKYIIRGESDKQAFNKAGKEAGWLLKSVIKKDKRIFDLKIIDRVNNYKWIQ